MKKQVRGVLVCCIVLLQLASAEVFSGYISELYASESGSVAFKVTGGFPDFIKAECPNFNGFGGNQNADDFLKSVLLAAKLANKQVRFSMDGCEGAWIKIRSVYIL